VKIWLIQNGRRVEKKKTAVLKRTLSPQFDETLMFHVILQEVRYTSLEIYVLDYDRFCRNDQIGWIVLGPKSGSNEVKHWNEMLSNTRQPVTRWHVLKGSK